MANVCALAHRMASRQVPAKRMSYCRDSRHRNHMGVAHPYCIKLSSAHMHGYIYSLCIMKRLIANIRDLNIKMSESVMLNQ